MHLSAADESVSMETKVLKSNRPRITQKDHDEKNKNYKINVYSCRMWAGSNTNNFCVDILVFDVLGQLLRWLVHWICMIGGTTPLFY